MYRAVSAGVRTRMRKSRVSRKTLLLELGEKEWLYQYKIINSRFSYVQKRCGKWPMQSDDRVSDWILWTTSHFLEFISFPRAFCCMALWHYGTKAFTVPSLAWRKGDFVTLSRFDVFLRSPTPSLLEKGWNSLRPCLSPHPLTRQSYYLYYSNALMLLT